jgi:hypothetical protein
MLTGRDNILAAAASIPIPGVHGRRDAANFPFGVWLGSKVGSR